MSCAWHPRLRHDAAASTKRFYAIEGHKDRRAVNRRKARARGSGDMGAVRSHRFSDLRIGHENTDFRSRSTFVTASSRLDDVVLAVVQRPVNRPSKLDNDGCSFCRTHRVNAVVQIRQFGKDAITPSYGHHVTRSGIVCH